MQNKVSNFIKESVEWLQKNQAGCCHYKLDDYLAVCVGWSAGYGEEKRDDIIQAKDDLDFGINAGIKVWTSDYMQTDFDWLNFPYDEDGEVWDMSVGIAPNDNYKLIAEIMLEWYEKARHLSLTRSGLILKNEQEEDIEEAV